MIPLKPVTEAQAQQRDRARKYDLMTEIKQQIVPSDEPDRLGPFTAEPRDERRARLVCGFAEVHTDEHRADVGEQSEPIVAVAYAAEYVVEKMRRIENFVIVIVYEPKPAPDADGAYSNAEQQRQVHI